MNENVYDEGTEGENFVEPFSGIVEQNRPDVFLYGNNHKLQKKASRKNKLLREYSKDEFICGLKFIKAAYIGRSLTLRMGDGDKEKGLVGSFFWLGKRSVTVKDLKASGVIVRVKNLKAFMQHVMP
ncbi:hypothetical protein HAX54_015395, partial [Datura stramonium]|nr:hypothetical protein [Datura stramonium]